MHSSSAGTNFVPSLAGFKMSITDSEWAGQTCISHALSPVCFSLFPPGAFSPSLPPFSHSIKPSLSLSLFSGASLTPFIHLSSGQWIHSQQLLYMHYSPSNNPSLSSTFTFKPPLTGFSPFLSLPSLFCLSPTYCPRGVIDKQAGVL